VNCVEQNIIKLDVTVEDFQGMTGPDALNNLPHEVLCAVLVESSVLL
jgi:hypothetical protein